MSRLEPVDPVVVLSPHLDDAVYSCAHFLSAHPSATVVTVMAGAPDAFHEGYNSSSTGESYAPDAVELRRNEDRTALAFLGATPIWLDLLDSDYVEYRPKADYVDLVRDEISRVLIEMSPATVIAPMGLIHPDHLAVSDASRGLWSRSTATWYLYMDLPYGLAHPRAVSKRLRILRRRVGLVGLDGYSGDDAIKQQAMGLYGSQFGPTRRNYREIFDATMNADERYWRVENNG
jgi:LmbE family N-acetylglucosaminyl deacetylase